MDRAISLGPLAFSLKVLIWLGAIWLGLWVGALVARRKELQMQWSLYGLLVFGLVTARLGFVFQYFESYSTRLVSIVDIRDGGWDPWTGLTAVAIVVALAAFRNNPRSGPMSAALLTTAVLGMGGTLGMDLTKQSVPELVSLELNDLDGNRRSLEEFRGKPLVINLWATWCPPCIREMPVFQKAQQDYPEIGFVFLNQAESAGVVRQFLQKYQITIDNLLLDQKAQVADQYGSRLLPTTLFFDANGKLADVRLGELSTATLRNRIEAILNR